MTHAHGGTDAPECTTCGPRAELSAARELYEEHGWSGCAGSEWDRLPPATQDGWRFAAERLAAVRTLAEGWVGFDDSHHYGDAVLKALGS